MFKVASTLEGLSNLRENRRLASAFIVIEKAWNGIIPYRSRSSVERENGHEISITL